MEFRHSNLQLLFPKDVSLFRTQTLSQYPKHRIDALAVIIDAIGSASAKAQGIGPPSTAMNKFLNSADKLYIAPFPPWAVAGFLRVRRQRISAKTESQTSQEAEVVCILDFYVVEKLQHTGVGYLLVQRMLLEEKISPARIAIEKPTKEALAFFQKYFQLKNPALQPSNIVVFEQFFSEAASIAAWDAFNSIRHDTRSTSSEPVIYISSSMLNPAARTPSAGRRKGVQSPQESSTHNSSLSVINSTNPSRRSFSRRGESKDSISVESDGFQKGAKKPTSASFLPDPLRKGVSSMFPSAPLVLKYPSDGVQSTITFPATTLVPLDLSKQSSVTAPWEADGSVQSQNSGIQDNRPRPNSVNKPSHKTRILAGVGLEIRSKKKDSTSPTNRNRREQSSSPTLRFFPSRQEQQPQKPSSLPNPQQQHQQQQQQQQQHSRGIFTLMGGFKSTPNIDTRRLKSYS
eukprot:TRINITY_DN3090_c0_g1_i1.p1 TRINITY_DN3090_c0_g1~~TRINITY_DN3090_c0_g1_i1.p1  ORF type:complete len:459 (-),score=104.16 TRINITY_DN3090_c0_g1_i1:229-1605(-)